MYNLSNMQNTFMKLLLKIKILKNLHDRIISLEKLIQISNDALTKQNEKIKILEESIILFTDDHKFDNFYKNFEDQFRGTEEDIKSRLNIYLPYFNNSKINFNKFGVIDLGSGRGEFIDLLSSNNFNITGIDNNRAMVERAKTKGLKAINSNVLDYMNKIKSNSIGAITGFHIVEHIPFIHLYKLLNQCYEALTKNGFVIFETPNPENITVGSCNFYLDPSHLKPIPPALMVYILESIGFKNIKINRIHPVYSDNKSNQNKYISDHLLSSQDYAVIGYK